MELSLGELSDHFDNTLAQDRVVEVFLHGLLQAQIDVVARLEFALDLCSELL